MITGQNPVKCLTEITNFAIFPNTFQLLPCHRPPGTGPASSSSSSNNTDQEKKGLTVITTMSHNNALVDRSVKAVKPGKLVRAGGSGYKILMVLEGEADVYLFPSLALSAHVNIL